jgi:S1-C subfamily serine protease
MVPSIEQPAVESFRAKPLTSRKFRTLLTMAILAGMATAAGLVLLMTLHSTPIAQAAAANVSVRTSRPSPFGIAAGPAIPPPDVKLTPPQIAKTGSQAVMIVTGYDSHDQPLSQANGYVYSPSGIIVTTFSAIRGASSVGVYTSNGDELSVIALMGYSPSRDLAVLAVLEGNLPALESGAGETVQEGDVVVAVGSNRAVYQGVVGPRRAIGGVDLIRIGAQSSPGSPVLNAHGKVIGVTIQRPAGVGAAYAVPSRYISDVLAERRTMSFAQMLEETGQTTQ